MRYSVRRLVAVMTGAIALVALAPVASAMDGDHHGGHGGDMHDGPTNRPVEQGARRIPISGDDFAFRPDAIEVSAGEKVALVLTAADIEHDIFVRRVGHIVHADAKKTARGGLRIKKAGTYKFWCTVAGHKAQGMTGTITVTSA
jgi:plastocyanin